MAGIEWVKGPDNITQGITVNSKTGCLNHTPEGLCLGGLFPCYAWKLAQGRLKQRYLNVNKLPKDKGILADSYPTRDPFYPRWWPERLEQIKGIKKPTGIFLDDMSDWMGDYWPAEWTKQELQVMRDCPQHRFYTLTKQPQNLPQFSPFPPNSWVGVTATDTSMAWIASKQLSQIEAGVKFLSIEPLLSWETSTPYTTENIIAGLNGSLGWLIIGACTGTYEEMTALCLKYPELTLASSLDCLNRKSWTAQPRIEWIKEIVEAADRAGIPIFLKDNLKSLLKFTGLDRRVEYPWAYRAGQLRQEMPKILYCSTCRVRRR